MIPMPFFLLRRLIRKGDSKNMKPPTTCPLKGIEECPCKEVEHCPLTDEHELCVHPHEKIYRGCTEICKEFSECKTKEAKPSP